MTNFKYLSILFLVSITLLIGCKKQEDISNETNNNYLTQIENTVCNKTITNITKISDKTLIEPIYLFNLCTALQHNIGFMHQQEIASNIGLLFVFPKESNQAFWMKNTYIPLDLAYLDKDGIVLSIHQLNPLNLSLVPSIKPAMYVIEMKFGSFKHYNITVGSKIHLN